MGDETADAVVIGAGIMGASIALALARGGRRVIVVERAPEAGYGSTSQSSAVIRSYYSVFESCALAQEGREAWCGVDALLALPADRPRARYRETGSVVIKGEANKYLTETCAMLDRLGIPYTDLAPEEVHRYLPGADLRAYAPAKPADADGFCEPTGARIAGAVHFPQAGYVDDPKLAAQNLQWAAEAAGARFLFRTEVTDILRDDRVRGVRLSDGREVRAGIVVNAGGPWSAGLNRMAGVEAGMAIRNRPNRQEVAYIPGPRNMDFARDGVVFSDADTQVYGRPDGGGICLGSQDPPCDPREFLDDPDAVDTSFTEMWTTIVMRAAQRFPELPVPNTARGLVALYDVTDDWLPIYDGSDLPGFYMACGTSGNQFKNGLVVGPMMAALIDAVEGGRDHDRDPLVYRLPRTGHEVSLGTWSRLRRINENSSFSVIG